MLGMLGAAAVTCGGKAVVDDGVVGSGGAGGSDASSSDSTASSVLCSNVDPSSELFECGFGTTGSGAGPCERRVCDTAGNEWRSSCEDKGCVCYFNGSVRCSCALDGNGEFCTGSVPSCCPDPYPAF
jgi:hypothetical protein